MQSTQSMLSFIQNLFKTSFSTCRGCKKEMKKEELIDNLCRDCRRWWGRIRIYDQLIVNLNLPRKAIVKKLVSFLLRNSLHELKYLQTSFKVFLSSSLQRSIDTKAIFPYQSILHQLSLHIIVYFFLVAILVIIAFYVLLITRKYSIELH